MMVQIKRKKEMLFDKLKTHTEQQNDKIKINGISIYFYTIFIFAIGIVCFYGYKSGGQIIANMLHGFPTETFGDYFSSILWGRTAYQNQVIYPPLIVAIYGMLGHFSGVQSNIDQYQMRGSQMGSFVFLMFMIFCFATFYFSILKLMNGNEKKKYFFVFIISFSLPFVFLVERGNSIILAVTGILIFAYLYNSNIRYKRHIAYIALSLSAGVKIYPAVVGLILIKKRRYKDAIVCLLYGIIIFFGPFLFFGDVIKNVIAFIRNILFCSDVISDMGYGIKVNIANTVGYIGEIFSLEKITLISPYLIIVLAILGVFYLTFSKIEIEEWKLMAICASMMTLLPNFSFIYTLLFWVVPLVLFLNSTPKWNVINIIYTTLFLALFIPIININIPILTRFNMDHYVLTFSTVVEGISLLLLSMLIYVECIFKSIKYIRDKKRK